MRITFEAEIDELAEWLRDYYGWQELRYMSADRLTKLAGEVAYRRCKESGLPALVQGEIRELLRAVATGDHIEPDVHVTPPPEPPRSDRPPSVFDVDEDGNVLENLSLSGATMAEVEHMATVTRDH